MPEDFIPFADAHPEMTLILATLVAAMTATWGIRFARFSSPGAATSLRIHPAQAASSQA